MHAGGWRGRCKLTAQGQCFRGLNQKVLKSRFEFVCAPPGLTLADFLNLDPQQTNPKTRRSLKKPYNLDLNPNLNKLILKNPKENSKSYVNPNPNKENLNPYLNLNPKQPNPKQPNLKKQIPTETLNLNKPTLNKLKENPNSRVIGSNGHVVSGSTNVPVTLFTRSMSPNFGFCSKRNC